MSEIGKTERLLNLVSLLLKSLEPVPWRVIRKKVEGYNDPAESEETVKRRFERDKSTLHAAGVPIEMGTLEAKGERGYFIPKQSCFLPRIELTPNESLLLAMAGKLALSRGGPVSELIQSALRKIQFDSPLPGDLHRGAEERVLFHTPRRAGLSHERERLRILTEAILRNKTVRFRYYSVSTGRTARRIVDPYGLGLVRGYWYLVGRDHRRRAIRTFRADRFRGKLGLVNRDSEQPDFHLPPDFRLMDYLEKQPWEFERGAPIKCQIWLDPTVAWMVEAETVTGDRWERHPDGSATLERMATDPDALIEWVLGFGQHAELLAPESLRQRLIEIVKTVRDFHKEALS